MDGVSIRILKEDGRSQYTDTHTDTQGGWTDSFYGSSRRMDGFILGYSARMDGVNRKILK